MDTREIASTATEALTRARQASEDADDAMRAWREHDPILRDHDWRLRHVEEASRKTTAGHGQLGRRMATMEAGLDKRLEVIEQQWDLMLRRGKQILWMIGIVAALLPKEQLAVLIANAMHLLAGGAP